MRRFSRSCCSPRVIIHTFGNAPDIVGYLDAVLVVLGLYLFIVLVIFSRKPGRKPLRVGAAARLESRIRTPLPTSQRLY